MKIAVLSDIHDHLGNLSEALSHPEIPSCEALLFLGDFCAPFTLTHLAKGFPHGPIHAVFGNNDGDPFLLSQVASRFAHVTLHGHYAELDLGGHLIALNHYPDISKRLAEGPAFHAVFSGHDHLRYAHRFGHTLWANPGEIMGRLGDPSFGIYDTADASFRHVVIKSPSHGAA